MINYHPTWQPPLYLIFISFSFSFTFSPPFPLRSPPAILYTPHLLHLQNFSLHSSKSKTLRRINNIDPSIRMGNCLRHEPPMQWAGEDWASLAPPTRFSGDADLSFSSSGKAMKAEEDYLLGENKGFSSSFSSSPASSTTEVKVKITKKQLEELLGRMDVQGLTVHQVLQHLMNASDRFETHQRSWRPALQSIPEVD